MRKRKYVSWLLACIFAISMTGCGDAKPLPEDTRTMTDYEYAARSISGTHRLDRVTKAGDAPVEGKRDVGLFYFLWLGAHGNKVYDVSDFEERCPDEIFDPNSEVSPSGKYHFWGKPLYGYYRSDDPWVVSRHVEMFVAAGIDFLVFDTSNGPTYDSALGVVLDTLEKYRLQGFAVPKIVFLTYSGGHNVVKHMYEWYYQPKVGDAVNEHYYPELWYRPNGKPLILGDMRQFDPGSEEEGYEKDAEILQFFDLRRAQWPDDIVMNDDAFPWISWSYPQYNHSGTMSVSVAQHVSRKMSLQSDGNWGRAFSFTEQKNLSDRVDEGLNIQGQWDTVFAANRSKEEVEHVDTVFVTGWNEWIAIKKYEGGTPFFVDNYNCEFSRDIEMDARVYYDNYYMQLVQNVRRYKYTDAVAYKHTPVTVSGADDEAWKGVRAYPDFAGDAMARDFRGYDSKVRLTDTTNRNDIVSVKVATDEKNAYFRIECAEDIIGMREGDVGTLAVWINATRSQGYPYMLDCLRGKLTRRTDEGYEDVSEIAAVQAGKVVMVTVPLSAVGVKASSPGFLFKVSDNVDASDSMNFYIQGDSAPIGRLSYTYGYLK